MAYLGFDVSTQSCKAVLVGADGKVRDAATDGGELDCESRLVD